MLKKTVCFSPEKIGQKLTNNMRAKNSRVLLVTRSPSDGIPREIRLLERGRNEVGIGRGRRRILIPFQVTV